MKTLDDFDFKGKNVLLRSDLNSDVVGKKVLMSERIQESSVTIKELKKKGARVVVIAHQGQPGKSDFRSLEQHSRLLNKFVKVKFVRDIIGRKAIQEIKGLKDGDCLLLENIRFEKDEFRPEKGKKNKVIEKLAGLFDVYVNDAFSVCHRKHVSVIGLPRYIKDRCSGRLLEREVNALKKIKIKKCLFVLGGAKPEDNLKLLGSNKVLSCGLFGQSCLVAKGKDLGFQNKYLEKEAGLDRKLKNKLRRGLKNVLMPLDFAVKISGKRKELSLEEFPSKHEIYDIGEKTIKKYVSEIKKARSIYMKGPAGDCGDKRFCKGTFELLKVISKNKNFSLISGGHLNNAIKRLEINKKKFGYVSLSGGAVLNYISGRKLPGLVVLGG